jgi:hypothetical protein
MRIISGGINTRFTHRPKERSFQRTPTQIMAVAFAAPALAFGAIAFAAGDPLHDVSAALTAAVADSSRPDSDTTWDADRKPEQTLAFSGIKPEDNVADYVETRLSELGITLPSLPQPVGNYVPFVIGIGSLPENDSVEIEAVLEVS